jgi:hypothetical protein
MDEDGNDMGPDWTRRAKETRLRERDVHHDAWCAAAQADGDGGCEYKRASEGMRERCRTKCGEGFFSMMSECSRATESGLIRALGPGPRRPEGPMERSG